MSNFKRDNFRNLDSCIDEILSATFGNEMKVKKSYYVEETEEYDPIWYFQFGHYGNEVLIEIIPFVNGIQLYTIDKVEEFNKEFPLDDDKGKYLSYNKAIKGYWFLGAHDAYRFIKAMIKHGFAIEE